MSSSVVGDKAPKGPRGGTEGPPASRWQDEVRTAASLCPSGGQWPETEHKVDGIRTKGSQGAVVQVQWPDSGDPALGSWKLGRGVSYNWGLTSNSSVGAVDRVTDADRREARGDHEDDQNQEGWEW